MRHWLVLILFLLGLGTLRVVACGEDSCVEDEDCNDGNPCTSDWCPEPPLFDLGFQCGGGQGDEPTCQHSRGGDGTPCGSGRAPYSRLCVDGVCRENLCEGVVCNGLCIEDECVPTDCDGLDDGTKCIFVNPLGQDPGFCEDGSCYTSPPL